MTQNIHRTSSNMYTSLQRILRKI